MSNAWEVTVDDVQTVLETHGIRKSDDEAEVILDELDVDAVEHGLLHYTDFDDQVASSLSDIEDQLMEQGVIPKGVKKFENPA